MAQPRISTPRINRIVIFAATLVASLLATNVLHAQHAALVAANPAPATVAKPAQPLASDTVLVDVLDAELKRAMSSLGTDGVAAQQPKPYFLSYAVDDASSVNIAAEHGAIISSNQSHVRSVDVQVRLGSPTEDNTHGDHRNSALTTLPLPLTDDREALARSLWYATNRGYGRALDGYLKVKTEQQVRAKEEDSSPDFSVEQPQVNLLSPAPVLVVDRAPWEQRLRQLSNLFTQFPDIFTDQVSFESSSETDYLVSSDGTRVATPSYTARLVIEAQTRAADGMNLFRAETFEADSPAHLPDQKTIADKALAMAKNLEALRVAPITEPFSGPAILSGRASAVFFHEVLGHRLEGQRQRGDQEGQTFTKLLNKPILPAFLSVADDPTLATFQGTSLSGHYDFDDEGQAARRVELIHDGILKTFLMSRQPIASFSQSNGHGRSESGHMPTGRQGKPYGLYFEDISSGFAVTTRSSPQAFQVIPLVVYRVYVDGRPDELVRGVSIVGTPQAALNSILATGDQQEIFNGICGAESGSIPVSAVAPAMLVSQIETQRQAQGTARPPILPPPGTSPDVSAPDKGAAR